MCQNPTISNKQSSQFLTSINQYNIKQQNQNSKIIINTPNPANSVIIHDHDKQQQQNTSIHSQNNNTSIVQNKKEIIQQVNTHNNTKQQQQKNQTNQHMPNKKTKNQITQKQQTKITNRETKKQIQINNNRENNSNYQKRMNKVNKQSQNIPIINSNNQFHVFRSGDIIKNIKKNISYKAIQLIGIGTFGQVLSVLTISSQNNTQTYHKMALKIIKKQPAYINQGLIQIKNLRQIAKYQQQLCNYNKNHIKLYDGFMWQGYLCIAMQLLDNSILNILESSSYKGLQMKWIQMWAKQLLFSLSKMHTIGIIHCDIKPQNIMFRPEEPEKPLLIDFSSSCFKGSQIFTYIQSRFYRSPQVLIGLKPYTNKIDIWSLGCVLAEMYLGLPIFPGGSAYDQISKIYKLTKNSIDQFEIIQMIRTSQFGGKYFQISQIKPQVVQKSQIQAKQIKQIFQGINRKYDTQTNQRLQKQNSLKLKTKKQYQIQNAEKVKINNDYFNMQSLEDMILIRNLPSKDIQTHQLFLDLIKKMLVFNPNQRITAQEAFLHPFIGGTYSELADLRNLQDIMQQEKNKQMPK